MAVSAKALAARLKKKPKLSPQELRVFNLAAAAICFIQGVLILIFANPAKSSVPIVTSFPAQDSAASVSQGHEVVASATRLLFDLNLAYLVAAFLLLGTLIYLLSATAFRRRYEAGLLSGVNKARWIDISLSFSLIIICVSLLSGVFDLSSLIMIFFLTLVLGVMGVIGDQYIRDTKSVKWLVYLEGLKYALVPWLVILIYFVGSHVYAGGLPTFMYFIYGSLILLLAAFVANFYLQARKLGHWENYLFGEKAFLVLAVVAKTAIAWQIFASALR